MKTDSEGQSFTQGLGRGHPPSTALSDDAEAVWPTAGGDQGSPERPAFSDVRCHREQGLQPIRRTPTYHSYVWAAPDLLADSGVVVTKSQIRYILNSEMDAKAIKRSLEGGGLRCTPQRYAVMAFLMDCHRHPTAAEIFEAVNRVDPRSSRATTYNNLRDLVEAGLVREVAVEGRAARFDAKSNRHHHFICDRCGNVEDIEWYSVPKPAVGSLGKRVLRDCELIFRGLCSKCAPRQSARKCHRPVDHE